MTRSHAVAALALLTFLLVAPAVLLEGKSGALMPSLVIAMSALGFTWSSLGRLQPAAAWFWAFTYTYFGLAPLLQRAEESLPIFDFAKLAGVVDVGDVVIALSIAGFLLGNVIGRSSFPNASFTGFGAPAGLYHVCLGGATVATVALIAISIRDVSSFFSDRLSFQRDLFDLQRGQLAWQVNNSGLPTVLLSSARSLSLLAMLLASSSPLRRVRRIRLLIAAPIFLLVTNPLITPRAWLFGSLLALAMVWSRQRRPGVIRACLVAGLVGLVFLTPSVDQFRGNRSRPGRDARDSILENLDYSHYAVLLKAVDRVEHIGHTLGDQIIGALFFFVPRDVWPGRALPSGLIISELPTFNFAAPLAAESYLEFGYTGVFVIMAAVGYTARQLDRRLQYCLHSDDVGVGLAFAFGFFSLLLRGSLETVAGICSVALAVSFVSSRLSRRH